jgi:methionine biosynthesis protein MetW
LKIDNPRTKATKWLLLKNSKITKPKILELGCGNGSIISSVAQDLNTTSLFGVDINEKALLEAAKKGIITHRIDLNSDFLDYPNNSFDIILMEEVIEHLVNPDHALEETFRLLKNGGYLLITTPNLGWWLNRVALLIGYQPFWTECSTKYNVGKLKRSLNESLSGHLRLYTLRALKELLKLNNFTIIDSKGITYEKNLPLIMKPANTIISKRLGYSEIIVLIAQKR